MQRDGEVDAEANGPVEVGGLPRRVAETAAASALTAPQLGKRPRYPDAHAPPPPPPTLDSVLGHLCDALSDLSDILKVLSGALGDWNTRLSAKREKDSTAGAAATWKWVECTQGSLSEHFTNRYENVPSQKFEAGKRTLRVGEFTRIEEKPSQPGSVSFFVSDTMVVKVYCIAQVGVVPSDDASIEHAVCACMDASATHVACRTKQWHCEVFGLRWRGLAHVCIARRKLEPWKTDAAGVGRFFHEFAIATGIVHWDGHFLNFGRNASTKGLEAIDFARASWYDRNPPPPFHVFAQYAEAADAGNFVEKSELYEKMLQSGLQSTRSHFRHVVTSAALFETDWTGCAFLASPTGSSVSSW